MKPYALSFLLLIAAGSTARASTKTIGVPVTASTAAAAAALDLSLLEKADALFALRTASGSIVNALVLYDRAVQSAPSNSEALWKSARAESWAAESASDTPARISFLEKGIGYAERAVKAEPRSAAAHLWLAVLYGSYGQTKGVLKSLSLLKPIRKELEQVIQLDDTYQGGGGYRVLGVVDYSVPGIAGGSRKRALENLTKALTIAPNNPFNQFYLADYYAEGGNKKEALEHIALVESSTDVDDGDGADAERIQIKARALREKLMH